MLTWVLLLPFGPSTIQILPNAPGDQGATLVHAVSPEW